MVKKLTKSGNSYSLVIDRAVMDLLGITPDTPIKMTTDGDEIRLKPLRGNLTDQQVDDAAERFFKKFGGMMTRLAQ